MAATAAPLRPTRHARAEPAPARGDGLAVAPAPTYVEIAPPPALAAFVECFWVHRVDGPPPPEGRRLLPDGRANMVWIAQVGVRLAGPASTYLEPPPLERMLAFGVRLRPGAVSSLLRVEAAEVADTHVLLEAIDPRLADRIDARLAGARDPQAAVVALAGELMRALADAPAPDPAVRAAVRALDDPRGTVADAAARAHVSERELQRRFLRDVGFAPKTLHRVLRFQRFMDHAQAPKVELAGAALLAGYADQAHLSREARRLAGLTPRQLLDHAH
jgi:AraC-like DNA-binding protein